MNGTMTRGILIALLVLMVPGAGAQQAYDKSSPDKNGTEKTAVPDAAERAKRESRQMKIELSDEPALVLGSMKITIGQAIEWAVKQNFDMLSVSYDVAMVDSMYNQFQKKFAPVLAAEAGGAYKEFTPSEKSFAGRNVLKADGSLSIYKNFSSGTTLIAGLSHEYDDFARSKTGSGMLFSGMLGPDNMHKPTVFISIQQELLKNAFGINDRQVAKILKNASTMQKEGIVFQLSLVVVGVIGDYWSTVMAKTSLENAELQVRETKKVRDITARNAAYGLADDYTLNLYNSMLAGAEAKMAMIRQKYRMSLREFLTTINVDENMEVSGTAVFSNKYPSINIEESLKTAYDRRADYKIAQMSLENAKMSVRINENNSLPALTAVINAASIGEQRNFAGAMGEVASVEYPAIEGKLKMTYPIGDKGLYTDERNARFKLKQAQIQLDKYRRKVKDDVMNAVESIESTYRMYQKAMEARKQSELFYKGMLRDLRLGRLNSAIVINGLNALVQSREGELQALVGYNLSLLMYDVARNELFSKYKIDVDKYIPKDIKKTSR
ncbi:MAG: TolC family protein [Spirochaetes bacterium]|nr:TolC family protein [Spirochaetota bacterium]